MVSPNPPGVTIILRPAKYSRKFSLSGIAIPIFFNNIRCLNVLMKNPPNENKKIIGSKVNSNSSILEEISVKSEYATYII
jgi:hypothetical protein